MGNPVVSISDLLVQDGAHMQADAMTTHISNMSILPETGTVLSPLKNSGLIVPDTLLYQVS